jgi:hypothetical protein
MHTQRLPFALALLVLLPLACSPPPAGLPDAAPDAPSAPVDCLACATSADCPGAEVCGVRYCDGVHVCIPTDGTQRDCPTVNGQSCPPVAAYDRCASASDCGPYAECSAVLTGSGLTVCRARCVGQGDCPPSPPGSGAFPVCLSDGLCLLGCIPPTTDQCPYRQGCQDLNTTPPTGFCR